MTSRFRRTWFVRMIERALEEIEDWSVRQQDWIMRHLR